MEYSNNKKFSKDVKEVFSTYSWPGNIRELDNIIKAAFVSSKLKYITLEDLPSKLLNNYENFSYDSYEFLGLHNAVENFEKSLIIKILKKNNWCCSKAAKEMNIHRSLLYKKIEKHKIYKTQK
ncbi:helix-turn-helix domain-containing protein [Fusobacterium mortiferum]|uniref:helix-turn-helix domain-containing protein n=1 Tax=Fusobacterium mortiferum TaxID=850 RepID=UPI003F90B971